MREKGVRAASAGGRPLRVLLVEDSENDALLLARELGRGGYEPLCERVQTAEGMRTALERADARGEPFEVVVSDYYMPRFEAPDALALLRGLGYEVPFIVVSGKIGEDAAVGIMKAGADDYLTKENMARLCPAIERELREAQGRRERRRAEEALRASEARFRRLVEQAADAIFVYDLDGNFVDVNRRACESLRYSREELLSMSVPQIEADHASDSLREMRREAVASGEPRTLEGTHRRKDGTTFPVEVRVGLLDSEGRTLMLALVRDVTEGRRAREELRVRDRAITASPSGVVITDPNRPDNPIVYVNPAFEEISGYAAEEVLGRNCRFLQGAGDPGLEELGELRAAVREGRYCKVELRNFRKDGTPFWNELSVSPVRDERGRLTHFVGVQNDVTERREAEEALARLASFPELNPNPVIETTVTGEPTYLNPAAWARFPDLTSSGARHPALRGLEEAYAKIWAGGGRPFVREARVGESFYQQSITRAPGSDLLRVYSVDITKRKQAEDALRANEERFRALVQNASDIVIVLDARGTIVYESPAVERVLGFKPEERMGEAAFGIVHPEDRDRVERVFAEHLGEPGPFPPVEYRVRHKDGRWRRLEAVGENLLHDPAVGGIVMNSRDITEREEAEAALKESEGRLQAILDNTSAVVYVKDASGRYTFVNRRYEELFGLPKGSVLGRTDHDLFPGESADGFRANDLEVLRSGEPLESEETVPRRGDRGEGGPHTYLSVKFPLRGPDGTPYAVCGISTDITERLRAEVRYRSLVEQLPAVTYVQGVEGDALAYVSPQIRDVLGYPPEEYLQNQELRKSTIHPDDRAWVLEEDGRTDKTGEPYRVECRRIRKDGSVIWARDEALLVRGAGGEPLFWQGLLTDVTERRRSEEALRHSEQLYRAVVEQAAEAIFLLDVGSLRVLEANAALGATLGYAPEELRGMSFYDISAHDRESIDRNAERAVQEGRLHIGERQYRRKDGSLVDVEISISTVPYGGGEAMCVVAHDVTGRKRAEEALREAREAERNRLARELHDSTLQDTVYALQEIQIFQVTAGLAGLAGPANPAGGGGDGGADLEGAAEALRRSVEGLRGAIFELRLDESLGRSFASSLWALVDLNRRMSRGRYGVDLVVEDSFPGELPGEVARQFVRVIQEALTNARRHAEPGSVLVRLGKSAAAGAEDTVYAEVSDDGRGFDPGEERAGVGQHSMRARAEELGGDLEVESRPGRGTTVRLRVPVSRLAD